MTKALCSFVPWLQVLSRWWWLTHTVQFLKNMVDNKTVRRERLYHSSMLILFITLRLFWFPFLNFQHLRLRAAMVVKEAATCIRPIWGKCSLNHLQVAISVRRRALSGIYCYERGKCNLVCLQIVNIFKKFGYFCFLVFSLRLYAMPFIVESNIRDNL